MPAFNASRLTVARQRRGMTKMDLARKAGLSTRSVLSFESGKSPPSFESLQALADVLDFPVEFFSASTIDVPSYENASFRSLRAATAGQRDAALAGAGLAIVLSEWLDSHFNLPAPNVPDLGGRDPEAAAYAVRAAWGLGEKPIKNVLHILEAQGVRVFSLAQECHRIDGLSLWRGETPYVFLSTMKSAERGRFDAAHELGHLVLHRHGGGEGQEAEGQAHQFASAFLMPRDSVVAYAPKLPTLDALVRLKKVWNVSVAALVHRLHEVKAITPWQYRKLYIELGRKGYRSNEPEPIAARETSQLLQKAFAALRQSGITKSMVAQQLHISPRDLDSLIFGLEMLTSVPGGLAGAPSAPRVGARADLRPVPAR